MKTVRTIFWVGVVAVCAFVFFNIRLFSIPSGSMVPTVRIGDYVLVWKMRYGWSKHSFPFSPNLFSGRIWPAEPERGDVVVFKDPRDNRTDYIKRVIGLPGDRVQMRDGRLVLNGAVAAREADGTEPMQDAFGQRIDAPAYREALGTMQHRIVESEGDTGAFDNTEEYVVPAGQYFVMGDNRDNSADSRGSNGFHAIPFENLIGKVEYVLFSIKPEDEGQGPDLGNRFLIPVQ